MVLIKWKEVLYGFKYKPSVNIRSKYLELLQTLLDAEDDVINGRVGSMTESINELRESLENKKKRVSKFNISITQ